MALTRSWETRTAFEVAALERQLKEPVQRSTEKLWLAGASLLIACGLLLVFLGKTQDFNSQQNRLRTGELINLNALSTPEQLNPVLELAGSPEERPLLAEKVWLELERHRATGIPNVGTLGRLRLTRTEMEADPHWSPARREQFRISPKSSSLPLVPLAKIKPVLVVRTPEEYRRAFLRWCAVYFCGFWLVHLLWRWRKFRGEQSLLPALLLLTGMGLILAVSIRDPLRDTLEFQKFAIGVAGGCLILLLPLLRLFDYRTYSRWTYTPLLLAFALFLALLRFGSGPSGSDAKVNLGPFQPVELVKVLLVFFMAGYLSTHWERLRELRQRRYVPRLLRLLEVPRIGDAMPVVFAVTCALLLFFALKDMGPALVTGFLFLTMFAVARGRFVLATLGILILVTGVALGYHLGVPHTVVDRVSMWLSPWDNNVRGGDQLAHALWAFATGGVWGSGPGWGDPGLIPAGHTDLVLPSLAEEWGIPGVAAIAALFTLLIGKAFQIASRAYDIYGTFLAAGLGTLLALEMLLISGGALGAIPLSGVVSPFLSAGNTAMLSNFLIFALLAGISHRAAREAVVPVTTGPDELFTQNRPTAALPFRLPLRAVGLALALCASALLARAVYLQEFRAEDLLSKDVLVFAADGVKRPERNPRLNLLAASIPRGNIYDRNGVLLATSKWADLQRSQPEYRKLGLTVENAPSRLDNRYYPFGPATIHLLGDLRTQQNFHASNASLVERDSNARLQGYSSVRDLASVVRYRHQLDNPALQALLNRDRDVHTTIDIRLQLKAGEILARHLAPQGKKGALVIMNAESGDLLALASWPQPSSPSQSPTPDELLDRARYGEYPPGSTFKLVTAIAALRRDPQLRQRTFFCRRLEDGRAGTVIPGWRRPIRDDAGDHPHGTLNMGAAIIVSCNAYFAQLGVHDVGTEALRQTADLLGINAGTADEVKRMLPFASYGQGPVVTTPFKLARVAATIADGGEMPEGRWVTDASNARTAPPSPILSRDSAEFLSKSMRAVALTGTAHAAMSGMQISIAGKTGTAQVNEGDPHSWFAGFAPYDGESKSRIAFAVIVEHGGYGAKTAAPIARELVEAAANLGVIASPPGEKK